MGQCMGIHLQIDLHGQHGTFLLHVQVYISTKSFTHGNLTIYIYFVLLEQEVICKLIY